MNLCVTTYTSNGIIDEQQVRVVFRFLFTIPLLILALDGIIGTEHTINRNLYAHMSFPEVNKAHLMALQIRYRLPADPRRYRLLRLIHVHAPHLLPALHYPRVRLQAESI